MPPRPIGPIRGLAARMLTGVATLVIVLGFVPVAATRADGFDHLLISEIATGGVGASDEFIELFNPGLEPLTLAGLEVAYASASGTSVSQRASWAADSPAVPPGGHVLLANEAGVHAAGADALYQGGLAESGGTVILRSLGAATAIDAVGWGTAAGSWLEGNAAPAPPPGWSLERLTSASDGLMQDTGDNAADFVERSVPTPQGAQAAAGTPEPSPMPMPPGTVPPSPSPTPSAMASPSPTPSTTSVPGPTPISIADARALPLGTLVTVDGTALTGSAFTDGGGHLADDSGGIAVIVEGGSFDAGSRVVVTGTLDDRFAQRTIRAGGADLIALGAASPIQAEGVLTGSIDEQVEGRLVRITAAVRAAPTALSAGLAFEVDDGSGSARVVVGSATGIDTSAWVTATTLELIGVVGQRDSSGSGASGYRILPRTSGDVLRITPPSSPAPSAPAASTPSPTPASTPSPTPAAVTSIAAARSAPVGTRLTLRGVVTLPPGVVDPETAVIQDETAAIVIRVGAEAGGIREGEVIEVDGVRSTKAGMETLRASAPPRILEGGVESAAVPVEAADVAESIEARLVAVTGHLLASARRAASGTVSFDVADGTGVVHVVLAASLQADDAALVAGASVEVVGVVGQETTTAEPLAGYRLWPRSPAEVRILASPDEELEAPTGRPGARAVDNPVGGFEPETFEGSGGGLDAVGTLGLADLRVGATLVTADWPGLAVAGLLWDGTRLVAVSADSASALVPLGAWRPPVPLALRGLRLIGVEPRSGVPLVALGKEVGDVTLAPGAPAPPLATIPSPGQPAAWVTLVGRLTVRDGPALEVGEATVSLDLLCTDSMPVPDSVLSVTGIGIADPARVIVPCDGIRAAPTLARSALVAPEHPGPRDPQAAPATGEDELAGVPSSADRRRTLAAWLLALGVLVVGGAAVAWRRLAAMPDAEPADDVDPQAELPDVPHLTLVRLRRDRGS